MKCMQWAAALSVSGLLLLGPVAAAPSLNQFVPTTPLQSYDTVQTAWLTYPTDGSVVATQVNEGGFENGKAMKLSFSPLQGDSVWSAGTMAQEAYQATWTAMSQFGDGFVYFVRNLSETAYYFKLQTDVLPAGGQLPALRMTACALRFYNTAGEDPYILDDGAGLYTLPAGFSGWMVVPASGDFSLMAQAETPNWRLDQGQDSAVEQIEASGYITGPDTLHFYDLVFTTGHGSDSGQAILLLDHLFSYTGELPAYGEQPGNTADISAIGYAVAAIGALGGLYLLRNSR